MKSTRIFFILSVALVIMSSCSNQPEDTIVSYLKETKGLDAKIYDLKKVKEITVADSINIMKNEANKKIESEIDSLNDNIKTYKKELADGAKTILTTPELREAYVTVISKTDSAIDSLRKLKPTISSKYDNRDKDEMIAIMYSCRLQSKKKKLSYFILSPDNEICYNID